MRPNASVRESGMPRAERRALAGVTLAEAMLSLLVFALVATGLTSTIIQTRRAAEDEICKAIAQAQAEGIIEQLQRMSYPMLSNVNLLSVPLRFVGITPNNHAMVQRYDIAWAPDGSVFTEIGERAVQDDPDSLVYGVLMDVEFQNAAGAVIRPRRYMKMKVNLTRAIDTASGKVNMVLSYQWANPLRKTASGQPLFQQRELRTVKSQMPTF